DRLLHRAGRVVGTEQDAVLLGGGVGAVGEGLVGVVLIVAAPLDPLAGVEHRRVAELLEVRLIEALVAVEELAERAVGVDAIGFEAEAAEVVVAGDAEELDLAGLRALAGDRAAVHLGHAGVRRDDHGAVVQEEGAGVGGDGGGVDRIEPGLGHGVAGLRMGAAHVVGLDQQRLAAADVDRHAGGELPVGLGVLGRVGGGGGGGGGSVTDGGVVVVVVVAVAGGGGAVVVVVVVLGGTGGAPSSTCSRGRCAATVLSREA